MDEQRVHADDGCRLRATRTGDGTPLMLCHGGPGLWDYFDDVAEMLRGAAHVIRWDQRGCGRSQRSGPYSIARSIADLDAVRDRLAGRRTAVLGKHLDRWEALGGRTRTAAEDREWAVLQWSADFAEPSTALREAERLATPWLDINYDCSQAINAEVEQELSNGDLATRCRTLDLPVLIIDGTEDIRPRWAVDSLHAALPNAERVSLAGAGHLPWVERPDDFSRTVNAFLTEQQRRHAPARSSRTPDPR